LVSRKPIWFWLAVLWHTVVDAAAVYAGQNVSVIASEGIIGVFALISFGIVFWLKSKFAGLKVEALIPPDGVDQATGQI
jgi:hypothetical protein